MARATPGNMLEPAAQNAPLAAMLAPGGPQGMGMPPQGMPGMPMGMPPGMPMGGQSMLSPNAIALQLMNRQLPWYAIPGMMQQPPPPMAAPPPAAAVAAAMAPDPNQKTQAEIEAAMAFGGANSEGG